MKQTNIAYITFKEKLCASELRFFRGAVIQMVGTENTLFHNHLTGNHLAYGYPLVQYKLLDNRATIVGIGEAADIVKQLADRFPAEMLIGKKKQTFNVMECTSRTYTPKIEVTPKLYEAYNYIALTDENYKRYHSMLALTDKISFLENIVTGNILSFLKGIGIRIEERVECAITELHELKAKPYKGIRFDTFDIKFVSNIELPSRIGLGKSVSMGFGTVKKAELPERFKNFH